MCGITLRELCREDCKTLAALEAQTFSDPWSEQAFEEELGCEYSITLVAVRGERVEGYLNAHHVLENVHINTFCVRPESRRTGVGRLLLQELVCRAEQLGGEEITLEVRAGNRAACGFYTSSGFRTVGVRKRFYRMPEEDALIMKKELEKDG